MTLMVRFRDRKSAGTALAARVAEVVPRDEPAVVLGVPNGGLLVARPIAKALGAPLDAIWVRRLALPSEPDIVLGAVDLDGDVTINPEAAFAEGLGNEVITELGFHTHAVLRALAGDARPRVARLAAGKTVIIVDDGMTTGMTLIAALRWARRHGATRRIVAVPVVDSRIWRHLDEHAEELVTLEERDDGPIAKSEVYQNFKKVPASTVTRVLREMRT